MGGQRSKIKQILKTIFRVRTWKLILVLIPLLFLAATLLRLDHLGMVELRDEVLRLDEHGAEEELANALLKLHEYTVSHIVINLVEENGEDRIVFGTGPFYLEQQYIKKAQEELKKAEDALANADDNPHGNVYKKAATVCDARARQFGYSYAQYIRCMTDELAKYPGTEEIQDTYMANIPSTLEYRRDFASPKWYPSWSGLTILVCLILVVVILIRFVIWATLRITLFLLKKR